jgi:hypothetical protein
MISHFWNIRQGGDGTTVTTCHHLLATMRSNVTEAERRAVFFIAGRNRPRIKILRRRVFLLRGETGLRRVPFLAFFDAPSRIASKSNGPAGGARHLPEPF